MDEFQPAPLPVHLVYTANRFLPIKVRAFLDFVGNTEAACDAACAGVGITVVGSHLVRTALERGALTALLDEFKPAPLPVHLVYTANRFLPIKVRAFIDFASPRLRRVLED